MFVDDLNMQRCAKDKKSLTKYLHSKKKHNRINMLDIPYYCLGQQKLLPNHVKIYGNDSVIPASKEAESELFVITQKIIDDLSDMGII